MKKIPKVLKQLPEEHATEIAILLEKMEREVYSEEEINNWGGLSRAERSVLIGIRKHMRERTSSKGPKGWRSARVEDIAKDSHYGESQTRLVIKGLEKKEVLKVIGKENKGPNSKRGYTIQKRTCCFRAT
jgi:hypothetical protein